MHSIFLNQCLSKLFTFEIFLKFDFKLKLSCLTFLLRAGFLSLGTQSTIMVKKEAKKWISFHTTLFSYHRCKLPSLRTFELYILLPFISNRFKSLYPWNSIESKQTELSVPVFCSLQEMSHSYWNSHKTAFQYE